MKELFAMANSNTLLALAYIRESKNPLSVICNLIQYCLNISADNKLRYDQLKSSMTEHFGLSMPNHVIDCCVKYLVKEKAIEKLPNGEGFLLIEARFDVDRFIQEKESLAAAENRFIHGLQEYVKAEFKIEWSESESYEYLSKLVLNEDFNESIIENSIEIDTKNLPKYISNTWYVKKYIFSLIENKSDANYDFFAKVFNGILVLNGLTQISDYNQEKSKKFRGTPFYLDTKILLRVLGFSLPYYTETALELVRLITTEYEGRICVFGHVIEEIKHALSLAAQDMEKIGYVNNFEIDYFQKMSSYSSADFKIAVDSVETRLENEFGFYKINDIDWNSQTTRTYWIDSEHLIEYISCANPKWSKSGIKNDVYALAQINIERKGNYFFKFGGKHKLPVFVTSNFKLVNDIKQYTFDCISNETMSLPWSPYKMPIISDYDLTCRLWLTSASKEPVSLSLIKTAYLYQQSDSAFYEKIKLTYQTIKEKHKYNLIDLDHERFEKLKEIVIEKTKGDIEEITDDVVVISFEELASRKSMHKDEEIATLSDVTHEQENTITTLTNNIIIAYAEKYINKISFKSKFVNWCLGNLPVIIAIIGIIVAFVLDYAITDQIINTGKLWALIPLMCCIIFEILDKKCFKESVIHQLVASHKQKCKNEYIMSITSQLKDNEKEYKERIIHYCIENTDFFKS